jgi:hypothetical protein
VHEILVARDIRVFKRNTNTLTGGLPNNGSFGLSFRLPNTFKINAEAIQLWGGARRGKKLSKQSMFSAALFTVCVGSTTAAAVGPELQRWFDLAQHTVAGVCSASRPFDQDLTFCAPVAADLVRRAPS